MSLFINKKFVWYDIISSKTRYDTEKINGCNLENKENESFFLFVFVFVWIIIIKKNK
jgi:hypothetical protein